MWVNAVLKDVIELVRWNKATNVAIYYIGAEDFDTIRSERGSVFARQHVDVYVTLSESQGRPVSSR